MKGLAFMRPSEDPISKRDRNRGLDKAPSLLLNSFHRCALKQRLSNFDELALKFELALKDIASGGVKEFACSRTPPRRLGAKSNLIAASKGDKKHDLFNAESHRVCRQPRSTHSIDGRPSLDVNKLLYTLEAKGFWKLPSAPPALRAARPLSFATANHVHALSGVPAAQECLKNHIFVEVQHPLLHTELRKGSQKVPRGSPFVAGGKKSQHISVRGPDAPPCCDQRKIGCGACTSHRSTTNAAYRKCASWP
jgi:hypothetical protein